MGSTWLILLAILMLTESTDLTKRSFRKNIQLYLNHTQGEVDGRKLIGGEKTSIGEHPYFVVIFAKKKKIESLEDIEGKEQDYSYCSGVMFREGWVLTAGHCVSGLNVAVLVGADDIFPKDISFLSFGDYFLVQKLIVHPDYYKRQTYANKYDVRVRKHGRFYFQYDVALIKLRQYRSIERRHISLARYKSKQDDPHEGRIILQLGVGFIKEPFIAENAPSKIQKLWQTTLSSSECKKLMPTFDKESGICLWANDYKYPVSGDSGGPYLGRRKSGEKFLMGIHSGTWHPGISGLKANTTYGILIKKIRPWIAKTMGKVFRDDE